VTLVLGFFCQHILALLLPSSFPSRPSFNQAQKASATKSSVSSSSSAAAAPVQQNMPNKILFVENLPVEVTGEGTPPHFSPVNTTVFRPAKR
jgi:RNA recognition motif-containing protein